jgi:hypothetical protein
MPHALIHGETVCELAPGRPFTDASGVQHPAEALTLWTDDEREAIGVFAFDELYPPEGRVIVSRGVAIENGLPIRTLVLADAPAPTAPAEVAMHKVHKAALLTPWEGHANLKAAIEAAFDELDAPSDALARIEWDKAPNLVRDGLTTAAVMSVLGMTEAQRDDLLIFAASLP